MSFTGTLQKCKACDKTVYLMDQLSADGIAYHKACFKCTHCKSRLQLHSYSSMKGVLYCKPHFEQLFKETGNFSTTSSLRASPCLWGFLLHARTWPCSGFSLCALVSSPELGLPSSKFLCALDRDSPSAHHPSERFILSKFLLCLLPLKIKFIP